MSSRSLLAALTVAMIVPAAAYADGSATIRFRNATGSPVYFCVDNTGRDSDAQTQKPMKDGRPGSLLLPGTTCRARGTNLFDRPTLRIYNANGEEIYAGKLCFAEARRRIDGLYHPYHQALRQLIEETEALFGGYLLVDCHSMPSAAGTVCGSDGADFVLGDCYGAACAPMILEAARNFLVERGFAVAINAPYAGGFTTDHYGDPRRGRHALQIEINRGLYMDERNYRRRPRFAKLAAEMSQLIERLSLAAQGCLARATG